MMSASTRISEVGGGSWKGRTDRSMHLVDGRVGIDEKDPRASSGSS
jgi:hypothetical protein